MNRRVFLCAAASIAALGLTACDGTPDYRYRLTVEVETPDGLKTGSSVIEVDTRVVRPGSNPAGRAVRWSVKGEAVAVDLPGGKTLFALLRSDNDTEWAARLMMIMDGRKTVPRTWPAYGPLEERSAYPMLVTFGDLSDPTSVAQVDPDDLAASFGDGVTLKRITVQMTNDPVTSGIEERLGWLSEYPEPSLDPDHGPKDFSLPATLHHGAFRQGVTK